MRAKSTIGIVGGNGWLGSAIANSIIKAGLIDPDQLILSYRSGSPDAFPRARWTRDNQELADRSDVIVISVRPTDWPFVALRAEGNLVVSVMAGIRLHQLSDRHGTERVVRALPNAAAEVGKSYTPWVCSAGVDEGDRTIVRGIFAACGMADELRDESAIDYLCGFSGTGPAFPALLAAAMMQDAIARGLDERVAHRAVNALIVGAGRLFEHRDQEPADIVTDFMKYRGVTAAAMTAMRAAGFDEAVRAGLAAGLTKSIAMGRAD